ncbi:GatB/YqeY domain-containing protein [Candidatus Pacearchaeota archaeon]|nr:GatB/YqeY domain-containing protein [Candidatus Pacearchaeota archaeon]
MSEILKQIRAALKLSMLAEVKLRKMSITSGEVFETTIAQKTVARAIISMFPEIDKKPDDATDDDVIKLLKKYISQEKERQLYIDKHITQTDIDGITSAEIKKLITKKYQDLGDSLTSTKIFIAQLYLPKQATEEEIVSWINDNLDLTSYKNKMQAMGPIMKQFKGCDGNFVKSILLKL